MGDRGECAHRQWEQSERERKTAVGQREAELVERGRTESTERQTRAMWTEGQCDRRVGGRPKEGRRREMQRRRKNQGAGREIADGQRERKEIQADREKEREGQTLRDRWTDRNKQTHPERQKSGGQRDRWTERVWRSQGPRSQVDTPGWSRKWAMEARVDLGLGDTVSWLGVRTKGLPEAQLWSGAADGAPLVGVSARHPLLIPPHPAGCPAEATD